MSLASVRAWSLANCCRMAGSLPLTCRPATGRTFAVQLYGSGWPYSIRSCSFVLLLARVVHSCNQVINRGGEGVAAKHLDAPFGQGWVKCKRQESHDCIVSAIHPLKNSIRLSRWQDGQLVDRGWCSCFETVQVGSVVEVTCQSIHPSGKFREPRLTRKREDKTAQECIFGLSLSLGDVLLTV
jgi:hypothetical protein